ncbi:MAG: hypothetical protein IPL40_11360 [Proteobacteria bacterium]|nr:hypothetical protein [Pseudomonadota bacterium]
MSIRKTVSDEVLATMGLRGFASNRHGGDLSQATAFRIETLGGGSGFASLAVSDHVGDAQGPWSSAGSASRASGARESRAVSLLNTPFGVTIVTHDRITETPNPAGSGPPEVSEVMSLGASLGALRVKALHAWVLGETRVIPNQSEGGGWTLGWATLDLPQLLATAGERLARYFGPPPPTQLAATPAAAPRL